MVLSTNSLLDNPSLRRWAQFFAKAAVLIGLLVLIANTAPTMPMPCVALLWAVLSVACAVGAAYHLVIRKTSRHHEYLEGGTLAKLHSGRVVTMVVAFVVSAIAVAVLLFEVPKWGTTEWVLVALSPVLYLPILLFFENYFEKQYTPLVRTSKAVRASYWVTGAVLCAAYLVALAMQPAATYASSQEAFLATVQPFAGSPSTILAEVGRVSALLDGLAEYAVSRAEQFSSGYFFAYRAFQCFSLFFAVASILGTCSLGLHDLKKVFHPLEQTGEPVEGRPVIMSTVVLAVALPLVLTTGFIVADAKAAEVVQTEEYTVVDEFVRDAIGVAADFLDGRYYEHEAAQQILADAMTRRQDLFDEFTATVIPLINESYDARIANVDEFLDWYYSLPADYERLGNMITNTAESYVQEQFTAMIEEGVDDSQLNEAFEAYLAQSGALKDDVMEQLAQHEVEGLPEWMLVKKETLDLGFLDEMPAPSQEFLGSTERVGASAVTGVASGVIAQKLVKKVATKEAFKKIVSKIASKLASKGVSSAVGGAVGTALGGPVGTAIGVAVGTGIGIGVDAAMLAIDESQNREQYKQEIVDAIEESRSETLALFGVEDADASHGV